MGSDTFYNERWLPWGVIRFVWAVTGVRRIPRRRREEHAGSTRGAEEGAGSACRASPLLCAAIWRRFLWEVIHSIMNGGFYEKRCALFGL